MENLNNVPSTGTFGGSVSTINSNFDLVVNAINSLEYQTTRSKGILNYGQNPATVFPNAVEGDWCMILSEGNVFPATIKTFNGSTWSGSGTWNPDGVDLTGYATTSAMNTAIANSLAQATARMGYGECTVSGTTLAVSIPNFILPTSGGTIHIKMSAVGTGASTLNINNTGEKTLWYNGAAVSSTNTWEAGEIISVFYDGTRFMASNSQGGGGRFSTGEKVGNVGIDNVPTKNSENIVKSGGVYSTTPSVSGGESELDIRDEESNILAQFYDGNFRTQKFDSAEAMVTGKTPVPLDIIDDNGLVIVRFENGHIKTRNFDSSNFASLFHSNLYQKKMCIIGDSYVANHNQSYTLTWHYKIAQENEMAYVNYGINGNGLVASGSPTIGTPVIDRYSEMDDDADYVIVVGGKNDYNKQLAIASFKTGLASICAGLIDKYVARGSKIAFFTPWDDYDSGTDPSSIKLIEYVDAIIEVCGKYSIPVFDSSRKSSMFMFNATFRTNYCQSSTDISHLNNNGHNLFKNKAFNFLNQL